MIDKRSHFRELRHMEVTTLYWVVSSLESLTTWALLSQVALGRMRAKMKHECSLLQMQCWNLSWKIRKIWGVGMNENAVMESRWVFLACAIQKKWFRATLTGTKGSSKMVDVKTKENAARVLGMCECGKHQITLLVPSLIASELDFEGQWWTMSHHASTISTRITSRFSGCLRMSARVCYTYPYKIWCRHMRIKSTPSTLFETVSLCRSPFLNHPIQDGLE